MIRAHELDQALLVLLASVEVDHARVVAAFAGIPGPAPRDRELAALFHAAEAGSSFLESAVDHPGAAERHLCWALNRTGTPAQRTAAPHRVAVRAS